MPSPANQSSTDAHYMSLALKLAGWAAKKDEVPVGALIVGPQGVISRAYNLRETLQTPLAHAEILALHRASRHLGRWRLSDLTLYSTLEPCVMCAGALVQSRISRLVYGAIDPKGGGVNSLYQITQDSRLNHQLTVVGGVMEEECSQILKDFFSAMRESKKQSKEM